MFLQNSKRGLWAPFKIIEKIGQQAYRLSLPNDWKIHPVFHVSLLRDWKSATIQEDLTVSQNDALEIEEPYWEVERILRWRKIKRKNRIIKEYLVLWKGFPIDEASWILPGAICTTKTPPALY